ncbi:MAG: DNA mismatch repair protein MutT [Rhodobacteraceae bacterium]|nr:DNA mismatch repair protein MutT [Paracoccaceae bacterium]
MTDAPPIRDAATVIVVRSGPDGPEVLMGQRGAGAAFMPSKFVFPGGAVDAGDAAVALAEPLDPTCHARLAQGAGPEGAARLAVAAIRELWEETGLPMAVPGRWPGEVPEGWEAFATAGLLPAAGALRFVFRAITPPGRTRRFDARFFLTTAEALAADPADFLHASDELEHLQWIALDRARHFDLPFITSIVLAEVTDLLRNGGAAPASVPFFDNSGPVPTFRRIA